MKQIRNLLMFILLMFIFQGCNTLYNFKFVTIEVVEPGKFYFPEKYSTAAFIYNNTNAEFNQENAKYLIDTIVHYDKANYDSIAAEIYYSSFINNLNNQIYFDSIVILAPAYYSNVVFSDSLIYSKTETLTDSSLNPDSIYEASVYLSGLLKNHSVNNPPHAEKKYIDPVFGLYSETDLKQISDSTNADILISLDFFTSVDTRTHIKLKNDMHYGVMNFYTLGLWNFYDLGKVKPLFYYTNADTINWEADAYTRNDLIQFLPPRKDAIFIGAGISGENFAGNLVPKWVGVERLYYISGQVDLMPAEGLVNEGKWDEAAEIWKKHINNPNKKIVAKCLYNLGIASEMEGDFDAAINWVVQSYHIFGNNNVIHAENCMDYINILGQRKSDIILLERQINPDQSNR